MDLRIEKLQKKYWAGESTLAEEKELKSFYRENPSLTKDGGHFRLLNEKKEAKPDYSFQHPGRKNRSYRLSLAAVILVLITAGIFLLQDNSKQQAFEVDDPAKALEITRASLMMVSEGLNKGKTYSTELNQINKAKKIIK